MRNNFKFRFTGILLMLAMIAVFGAVVMLLWNALMPQIFSLPQIGYLQAAGLLILARLLLGGIGGGLPGHGGHRGARDGHPFHNHNKLREKWMNMSEEERKEFMEKEKDFFKFHRDILRSDDFFSGGENKKGEGNE